MTCAGCGRANRDGARFCGGCGAALAARCASCGAESQPGARFCDACGAPLAARPGVPAERKVVTIVFADLIGSTAVHERLDPESVSRLMDRYHRAVRVTIEAHGGTVVSLLGDGVLCAFGVPRVAEDDAIRAVRAGVEVQRAFRAFASGERELAGELGLRVAINTGEVVVSDDYAAGIGDPLNVAARLQQEARDGDVLVSESTQRIVGERVTLAPVGRFALKGRAEPVAAFRVVSLERPAGAAAIAFVGREDELRRLHAVYDAAVAAPAARLAVVLGSPGLGKSRLLAEFARRLGDRAAALTAHCNAAGGASFAPLAEALRAHLGAEAAGGGDALRAAIDARVRGDEAERARIAAGIGALLAGTPAPPEETFFVVRRLLAALAAAGPVLFAIDDLQWAEPLLLDLVEHLVQWGGGIPLLVLAAARPELRDVRAALASPGGIAADVVTLAGLDAAAATRLAASVIGADALPAAVAGRVLATSEGNPLFLGELVRMLVNDGALRREGERWTTAVELAELTMPPTIQALLAARIERLRPEERLLLERASVVGRQFSRGSVAHLLPREAQADIDARLEALRRSELVESDTGWFLGEPALRFHHLLIRDAAYRRLLRNTRAELHARLADWIESRVGDSVEHDETIGWHLEQAHEHLRELGPLDEAGRALGARAARHLGAAGRRALARDDLALAAGLLARAVAPLDRDDAARADLVLDWCEALLAAGDVGPAAGAVEELGRLADGSDRLRAWHTCFAGQLAALTDPKALRTTADAVASAAARLAAANDAAGEAKAHQVHASALARLGAVGAAEAALDRALAAARRAGDRRRANAVLAGAPLAALWGPSPVTRASGRCLDVVRVLRITQGAPAVEAVALRCQAVLEALRGRSEAARRMIASSRHTVEELGSTQQALETDVFAGQIELLEGDAAAAERLLRSAYAGLRERGLAIDAARAAALLGRALLAQGRPGEAEAVGRESEALAGDDLKAAMGWRGVCAEALAQRGEHAAAVELARAAVEIGAATDALLDHADARLALAAALRAAGRGAEADAEATRAIELWEAKGATLLVERARGASGHAAEPSAAPPSRLTPRRGRVRANLATASAARLEAAIAARDANALPGLLTADFRGVHRPTGSEGDRNGPLQEWGELIRARGATLRIEPLATLGDTLALLRNTRSFDALVNGAMEFGTTTAVDLPLIEVDAEGRTRSAEIFAEDHLSDAVARLYERWAELLPDGSERDRAAVTARVVAKNIRALDSSDLVPELEFVDHRTLGLGSAHGAKRFREMLGTLFETSGNLRLRAYDVLTLSPDAMLLRWTSSGTERTSGGAWERVMIVLFVFAPDGRVARWEQFDADREEQALARLDALMAQSAPPPARRRVRPNAATANEERLQAAIVARDLAAFGAVFSDSMHVEHHPTGATWGREEAIENSARMLATSTDWVRRSEPLATLGESLALIRIRNAAGHSTSRDFDVGAIERENVLVIEVGPDGRRVRVENFGDHLGEATARLYARHAELQPDGPEQVRGAATARVVSAALGPYDIERYAAAQAPDVEFIDHRTHGIGPLTGAQAVRHWFGSLLDVAEGVTNRFDDVLGLCSDALLLRWTNFGTERSGGGGYERQFLWLGVFGADGRLTRIEQFEADRADDALACFEGLARELAAPVRIENAATRAARRFDEAWAARDWDRLAAVYAPGYRCSDRRSMSQLELDREQFLASNRAAFGLQRGGHVRELLATRGERLALYRVVFRGDGGDIGPLETEWLSLNEVDERGAITAGVMLDADAVDAAYAELEKRFDLGEAAPYQATRQSLLRLGRAAAARDWESMAAVFAPDSVVEDHRSVGVLTFRSGAEYAASARALVELTPDAVLRGHHVLAISERGTLSVSGWSGTRDGGAFETVAVTVRLLGPDRRIQRMEFYGLDQLDLARARYAELCGTTGRPSGENAATRALERFERCWRARDWDGVVACYAPAHRMDDRRRLMHMQVAGEAFLANERLLFDVPGSRWESELLATRGERLALFRVRFHAEGGDRGPTTVENLDLVEVDADGRRTALVVFDPDDLGAAHTELERRFAASGSGSRPAALRVRENAATASAKRMDAAMAARDAAGIADLVADGLEAFHHPTAIAYDRQGALSSLGMLMRARDLDFRHEPLATLGDALGLFRCWTSFSELAEEGLAPFGAIERESLVLFQLDSAGRQRFLEFFAPDRLGDAIVRLYARHAELLPEGPERRRAAAIARTVATWTGPIDLDLYAASLAPGIEVVDHRILGNWSALGAESALRHWRSLLELADIRVRNDALLALAPDACLVRRSYFGTVRADGGTFEDTLLLLAAFGEDGLVTRVELFQRDREADALARFDALVPAPPARPRFENAATRAALRIQAAFEARDRERHAALFAPGFRYFDRRRMVQLELDRERFLEFVRSSFELGSFRLELELLATRGDRLALARLRMQGAAGDSGLSEIESLHVYEVNERGEHSQMVRFDPDDLDAAHAELDERYREGEGAPYAAVLSNLRAYIRAVAPLDDDLIRDTLPADVTFTSHRRLLQYERVSRDAWLTSIRNLGQLGELEMHSRVEHIPRLSASAGLLVLCIRGTVGGGPFETRLVLVFTHDGRRPHAVEEYDLEQLDEALARFDALATEPSPLRIENAATRHMEQHARCWRERDWDGVLAGLAPTHSEEDRRGGVRLTLDTDQHVASMRLIFDSASVAWRSETLATRGDRLALFQTLLDGEHEGARFQLQYLQLSELDAHGRRTANVLFDPGDLDAAYVELDARFGAGEGAPYAELLAYVGRFLQAFNAADDDTLRRVLPDDLVVFDHRPLVGTDGPVGRDAWIASFRALDAFGEIRFRNRIDHLPRLSAHAGVHVVSVAGTAGGGEHEGRLAIVFRHDGRRFRSFEIFDLEQLDAALARFDVVDAEARRDPLAAPARLAELQPDPLRIPPNAATRARDALQRAREADDREAAAAVLAPDMVFDDRRRGIRLTGDRDTFLASMRFLASARTERTLLATAGERLALDWARWHADRDGPFELDVLTVWEIDAHGRIASITAFDPDDRRAAWRELLERHARSESGRALPAALHELRRALLDRDLERARAALPPDFAVRDHRRNRLWSIEGRDAWVAWTATLFEQSPDAIIAPLHHLAIEAHGNLTLGFTAGTLPEGGAFEQVFVSLYHFRGGRLAGQEMFEVDDLERARARLEELRPARGE